tara:strand:- start:1108 stop:3276 length:2169 start_codon:yes stop_codon:yes gene_type:complete
MPLSAIPEVNEDYSRSSSFYDDQPSSYKSAETSFSGNSEYFDAEEEFKDFAEKENDIDKDYYLKKIKEISDFDIKVLKDISSDLKIFFSHINKEEKKSKKKKKSKKNKKRKKKGKSVSDGGAQKQGMLHKQEKQNENENERIEEVVVNNLEQEMQQAQGGMTEEKFRSIIREEIKYANEEQTQQIAPLIGDLKNIALDISGKVDQVQGSINELGHGLLRDLKSFHCPAIDFFINNRYRILGFTYIIGVFIQFDQVSPELGEALLPNMSGMNGGANRLFAPIPLATETRRAQILNKPVPPNNRRRAHRNLNKVRNKYRSGALKSKEGQFSDWNAPRYTEGKKKGKTIPLKERKPKLSSRRKFNQIIECFFTLLSFILQMFAIIVNFNKLIYHFYSEKTTGGGWMMKILFWGLWFICLSLHIALFCVFITPFYTFINYILTIFGLGSKSTNAFGILVSFIRKFGDGLSWLWGFLDNDFLRKGITSLLSIISSVFEVILNLLKEIPVIKDIIWAIKIIFNWILTAIKEAKQEEERKQVANQVNNMNDEFSEILKQYENPNIFQESLTGYLPRPKDLAIWRREASQEPISLDVPLTIDTPMTNLTHSTTPGIVDPSLRTPDIIEVLKDVKKDELSELSGDLLREESYKYNVNPSSGFFSFRDDEDLKKELFSKVDDGTIPVGGSKRNKRTNKKRTNKKRSNKRSNRNKRSNKRSNRKRSNNKQSKK